jgi:hypothetical protein
MSKTFLDACVSGEALLDEIDDYVAKWHQSDVQTPIAKYLGFTPKEYEAWVEKPDILGYIVVARAHNKPLEDTIKEGIAARSPSRDGAKALLAWLKKTGRIL